MPQLLEIPKKNIQLFTMQQITKLPAILIFTLAPWIDIDSSLTFNVSGTLKHYILKGIIYYNGNHFTARIIDKDLTIWYHNGQTTYSSCQIELFLMQHENHDFLKTCNEGYKAIMVFYTETNI